MYDILIPSAEKDFVKLRFVYDSIMEYLEGFGEIYCITNVKIPDSMKISGVNYFLDEDVLDFDFSRLRDSLKERTGWYKQQFIKLFQAITFDEYLVLDADIVFNRKVDIIEDGKPVFLLGKDQHHPPYFALIEKLFGFGREYPYSFINEVMYFKRSLINHLVTSTGFNKYGFFELVTREINQMNDASGFSEYELYGNYVTKYFPDLYNYKHIKTHTSSKHEVWTEEEIENNINKFKESDCVMIKMHSWV